MPKKINNHNSSENNNRLKEIIYTSESKIRHPIDLFKDMWRDLLASRELTWQLLVRDISAQYRQSLLGILWVFITPLATAGIFIMLKRQAILNVDETGMPYPVFALIGTTLWQTFVESINAPLKSLTAARPVVDARCCVCRRLSCRVVGHHRCFVPGFCVVRRRDILGGIIHDYYRDAA